MSGFETKIYVTNSIDRAAQVYPDYHGEQWHDQSSGLVDVLYGLPFVEVTAAHFEKPTNYGNYPRLRTENVWSPRVFVVDFKDINPDLQPLQINFQNLPRTKPEKYSRIAEIVEAGLNANPLILIHDPRFDPTT